MLQPERIKLIVPTLKGWCAVTAPRLLVTYFKYPLKCRVECKEAIKLRQQNASIMLQIRNLRIVHAIPILAKFDSMMFKVKQFQLKRVNRENLYQRRKQNHTRYH